MRIPIRPSHVLRLAALAAVTISCNDSPTGPTQSAPNGTIVLSDSVFTRGAVVRARVGAPAGYALVPGSVTWTVVSGGASLSDIGGTDDSVDVAFTGTGPAQLRASYTLRGAGVGSSLTIAGPTRRPGGDVAVEASRTLTVASAVIDYTALPTASVTAGTTLGNVQVAIKDVRGRIITTATDSIVIALDPTSGAAGATLLGTLRARPTAGVATFAGMSIQKAGTGYRLIASSPTLTSRDTATTAVVAGAPSAAQSTIVVADTIRTVGQTTTVTVTLKDQYGNPVLTATPASFTPSASGGTLGAFNCANGVCTATYTAPNTPGAPTIGATIGGTQIPGGPQTVTVLAGAAAKLVITGDSTQAAGSSKNLTITAYDALGNVATSYAGAKSLTFSGANNAPIGTVPTIAATDVGTAVNVTFTNGVATLVASVLYKVEVAVLETTDGTIAAAGADRLSVRVFNAAADAAQSTLAVADSVRSGGDSTTVTVTLKDAYGNPVLDGTAASFSPSASAGTLRTFSCTNGVCTAQYVAPATVATHTISATIGSTAIGGSPKTVRVPDTTPPAITGPSGAAGDATAAKSVAENTTAVHTM
ncbi:MAG: invasin domain 3-containing protein, partial [Gemmatimonadaceae bacterium]